MAKGARASSRKANNSKLKSKVFGPIETERTARLSAKLLELASQPKPAREEAETKAPITSPEDNAEEPTPECKPVEAMEVDQDSAKGPAGAKHAKNKRRMSSRKASIVFPKFKNGKKITKTRSKR